MLPGGDRVRKTVHPLETCPQERVLLRKQIQREFEIYQRLGPHPRFIRMLGLDTACDGEQGIVLEYMPKGDLHEFLQSDVNISMERRLQWCVEAATAVVFLHSLGIIHADIRPQNMLLYQNLGLRLIDLAGASIDGKEPLSLENTRFFLPRDCRDRAVVSVTTDMFALGSSFYEIVTRKLPYPELKSDEVERRYARQEFPQVEDIALGDIIRGCWMGDFTSAAAVLDAIEYRVRDNTKVNLGRIDCSVV